MNERLLGLRQRRGELLARIASQREQMAQIGARWEAPLAVADKGLSVLRSLRSRPALVLGALALLVWRRRGVIGLVRTGWLAWRGYRAFLRLAAARGARPL